MKKILLLAYLLFAPIAAAQNSPYSDIVLTSRGTPAGGSLVAVCGNPGLATTAAQVTSNIAILTMTSNPITAGFFANMTLSVSGFTGGDTYFNGTFTILTVTATTITYGLIHSNASAGTNGSAFQTGNASTACAPLSTISSDPAGAFPITQPGFAADGLGNFQFYAPSAAYTLQFYGPVLTVRTKPIFIGCIPGSTCAAVNVVNTWTALQTFTAGLTVSGGTTTLGTTLVSSLSSSGLVTINGNLSATANAVFSGTVNQFFGNPTPTVAGGSGLGQATLPWNTVIIGTSAVGNNFSILGIATAGRNQTLPDATGTFFISGNGDGTHSIKNQSIRFAGNLGGTCPTAAAIGAACTSGNINWTTPFPDNSYTVVCTLNGALTGQPHIVATTYQAGGVGITLTIAADTAVAANVAPTGFTDCVAIHD